MSTLLVAHDLRRAYSMLSGSRSSRIVQMIRSCSVHGVVVFRFRHWLRSQPMGLRLLLAPVSIYLDYRMRSAWGIEIHSSARIGKGFVIVHNGGIFVSSKSIIGENFTIAHDVTIGTGAAGPREGAPTIGDNVTVNAGAKVYGGIRVGNNARIGPNTIVNRSIPENVLVHLPAMQVVSFGGFYRAPEEQKIDSETDEGKPPAGA